MIFWQFSAAKNPFGRRGMHYTIGRKNTRATVGLPGSGIFVTDVKPRRDPDPPILHRGWTLALAFLIIGLAVLTLALSGCPHHLEPSRLQRQADHLAVLASGYSEGANPDRQQFV